MLNFNLKIWQFVRIMVELEETKASTKDKNKFRSRPVYKDWKDKWLDIDNKLEELNQSNHLAYSNKMMVEEVSIDFRSKAQLNEVISSLDRVIRKIKMRIKKSDNNQDNKGLNFEKVELGKLKNDLVICKNDFI